MTSIRKIQTERLAEDVIHTLYAQGVKPTFSDITTHITKYFSTYPSGETLPLPLRDAVASGISDVEELNRLLAHLAINLNVLYETSVRQVEEVLDLNESLQSHLDRLKKKRRRIEEKINDFFAVINGAQNFLYSVSDSFPDLEKVDLDFTTAQVDTTAGAVVLPSATSKTKTLSQSFLSSPSFSVNPNLRLVHKANFVNAVESSLRNVAWSTEAVSTNIERVELTVDITVEGLVEPPVVSSVEILPFGASPTQISLHYRTINGTVEPFSNQVKKSSSKIVFNSDAKQVTGLILKMIKDKPDYSTSEDGNVQYRYSFGAREFNVIHKTFESQSRVVSKPISIPEELAEEVFIDAVSLDVEAEIPNGCKIEYYVANTTGEETEITDFSWKRIRPVQDKSNSNKVIRFDGSATKSVKITNSPSGDDLEIIPLSVANPSRTIIPGSDIYRIAKLKDFSAVPASFKLIEGVDTVRIYSKAIDADTPHEEMNLPYWASTIRDDDVEKELDYSSVSAGNEFFYGGDVGAIGKDIFVETFLRSEIDRDIFLDEFQKSDLNSRTWDIQVFLNGRSIGKLPAGTDSAQLPWRIRRGVNHIVLSIRIPQDNLQEDAFLGSVELMASNNVARLGEIFLNEWRYADFFNLKFNDIDPGNVFSIFNGEIVSRKKPATEFRLTYSKDTGAGPQSIRFRADLSRDVNSATVTPKLDKYSLRFAYGDN